KLAEVDLRQDGGGRDRGFGLARRLAGGLALPTVQDAIEAQLQGTLPGVKALDENAMGLGEDFGIDLIQLEHRFPLFVEGQRGIAQGEFGSAEGSGLSSQADEVDIYPE